MRKNKKDWRRKKLKDKKAEKDNKSFKEWSRKKIENFKGKLYRLKVTTFWQN